MAKAVPLEDRQLLAYAGIAQGVIDFPLQDRNEIADSLQPIAETESTLVFDHPRFLLEVASDWRSLREMQGTIGQCPYLLLTHLTIAYNQMLLDLAERQLETLVYGEGEEALRARPFPDLEHDTEV